MYLIARWLTSDVTRPRQHHTHEVAICGYIIIDQSKYFFSLDIDQSKTPAWACQACWGKLTCSDLCGLQHLFVFFCRAFYSGDLMMTGQGYEKRFFILLDWPFLFRSLFQSTWNVEGQMLVRAAQQRFSVHMPVLLPLPQPRYVFEISSVGFLKCVDVEGPRPVSSFSACKCANIERFNSTYTQTDQTESRWWLYRPGPAKTFKAWGG